ASDGLVDPGEVGGGDADAPAAAITPDHGAAQAVGPVEETLDHVNLPTIQGFADAGGGDDTAGIGDRGNDAQGHAFALGEFREILRRPGAIAAEAEIFADDETRTAFAAQTSQKTRPVEAADVGEG